MVEAVTQGECTECGSSDNNWDVVGREYESGFGEEEETSITRELSCECGASAVVEISESGMTAEGEISHEDASWNQDDDSEEEDDSEESEE